MTQKDFNWDDDKVIEFVNWYLDLQDMDFRFYLENKYILESFKNGDSVSAWSPKPMTQKQIEAIENMPDAIKKSYADAPKIKTFKDLEI